MSKISKNTLDTSKSIYYEVLCIKCQGSTNNENMSYNSIIINNDFENEFVKLSCENCTIKFCYILCAFCNNKIYMKINPNDVKYNGIEGFNIKCPYESCKNYFYFTECMKCKRSQKHKKFIKEGEIITCLYDDCKCNYIQVSCPVANCPDVVSIEKPNVFKNFPLGFMSLHKNEVMFQKINCSFCFQPIVFFSNKEKKNKYIECQQVVCPYNNCGKTFNRIICPFCFDENYVDNGWYEMGSKIKCKQCHQCFGKILCVSCGKNNICNDNFFHCGKMVCGFKGCTKENYMINCIYCRKLNLFNKKKPIIGQVIKCGYCKKKFNEIYCPFCNLINPFPSADFSFGKTYKCIYLTCSKSFQFMICPNCLRFSFVKETKEGKKYRCSECQTESMNWGCPFCKSSIMSKNTNLEQGQMIKCPSKKCGKIYSFIRCSKCEKLIFSKENQNIFGMSVKCQNEECGSYTLISKCPKCNTKARYSGNINNFEENKKIECPSCKEHYIFKRDKNIYKDGLYTFNEIEGESINFGVGEIDENYLIKKDLFFEHNLYVSSFNVCNSICETNYSKTSIKNKLLTECIVCHDNIKESVFYPCGHRCACYNCAIVVFTVHKKCPKCNQKAECIIKKVYE